MLWLSSKAVTLIPVLVSGIRNPSIWFFEFSKPKKPAKNRKNILNTSKAGNLETQVHFSKNLPSRAACNSDKFIRCRVSEFPETPKIEKTIKTLTPNGRFTEGGSARTATPSKFRIQRGCRQPLFLRKLLNIILISCTYPQKIV